MDTLLCFDDKRPLWPSVRVDNEPKIGRFTISLWGWTDEAGPSIASIRGSSQEMVLRKIYRMMPVTQAFLQRYARQDLRRLETVKMKAKVKPLPLSEFFLWRTAGFTADETQFLPAVWLPTAPEESGVCPQPWWPDPKYWDLVL